MPTLTAREVAGGPKTKYKMKIIYGATNAQGSYDYVGVLQALEQYDEPGWEVCGVTPGQDGALVVSYRRIVPS